MKRAGRITYALMTFAMLFATRMVKKLPIDKAIFQDGEQVIGP